MGTVDLMTSDISSKEKRVRFTTISLTLISDLMSRLSSFPSLMTNAIKLILEQKCTSYFKESAIRLSKREVLQGVLINMGI